MSEFRERVLMYYRENRLKGYRPKQALSVAKFKARYRGGIRCPFDNQWGYAGEEERVYSNGWKLVFKLEYDYDCGPPEKECEGHGPTEWVHRSLEDWERDWVLRWDGYSKLLYNHREAYEIAKRDGWCMAKTDAEIKAAVQKDFDYLYGYYNDHWHYVGIIVELQDEDGNVVDEDSCWGYDTYDPSYLDEEARSWAAHMLKKNMPRYWQRLRQMELTLEAA